jgi:hypothetical protein
MDSTHVSTMVLTDWAQEWLDELLSIHDAIRTENAARIRTVLDATPGDPKAAKPDLLVTP